MAICNTYKLYCYYRDLSYLGENVSLVQAVIIYPIHSGIYSGKQQNLAFVTHDRLHTAEQYLVTNRNKIRYLRISKIFLV